jgi:hypothetical protein
LVAATATTTTTQQQNLEQLPIHPSVLGQELASAQKELSFDGVWGEYHQRRPSADSPAQPERRGGPRLRDLELFARILVAESWREQPAAKQARLARVCAKDRLLDLQRSCVCTFHSDRRNEQMECK